MDKKYSKLQEAGIQVPFGWNKSDNARTAELKAFARGKGDSFFPRGWLMTADMLAAAQAAGYTLSDVAEASGSSSSGNALGSETSNPSASNTGTEGTGNVPSSAQGTGSSLNVPHSANANEESSSDDSDDKDESADYPSEEEE